MRKKSYECLALSDSQINVTDEYCTLKHEQTLATAVQGSRAPMFCCAYLMRGS